MQGNERKTLAKNKRFEERNILRDFRTRSTQRHNHR